MKFDFYFRKMTLTALLGGYYNSLERDDGSLTRVTAMEMVGSG